MTKLTSESINEPVDQYLLSVLPEREGILSRMEAYGLQKGFPFVGPLAGNLLEMLALSIRAKRILDLGSGFGFSAMHFALVTPDDAEIVCVDDETENRVAALKFFEEAGVLHKIIFQDGDAIDLLKSSEGEFDLIYCDIYKEQYPEAFKYGWPRIRVGGYFVADNLLWHGRVMTEDNQDSTQAIRELSRLIYATPNAKSVIVPFRDGLSVSLKTSKD
jgi:caffeoyl-CoA O-methyltransferase